MTQRDWAVAGLGLAMSIVLFSCRCLGAANPVDGVLTVVFLSKRADTAVDVFRARARWIETNSCAPLLLERAASAEPGREVSLAGLSRSTKFHIALSQHDRTQVEAHLRLS